MIKPFQLFIVSASLFFLILSCEKSMEPIQSVCDCNSDENTMNMVFSYGVGSKNILNTFECTYTKDMVMDPSITIFFKLTKSELDSIYEKMNNIDFFSYPDTFQVIVTDDIIGMITPFSTYQFHIESDTIQKNLYWEANIINPDQKAEKLRDLIHTIIKIIKSKDAYQQLPNPRGGYI